MSNLLRNNVKHYRASALGAALAVAGIFAHATVTDAAVPLAKEGNTMAIIVHNGNEKPAQALADYIEKSTGAAVPTVENREDDDGQSVVELRLADKVPGASDKLTAEHAYRLKTDGNRLLITAQSKLGLEYAVYGLLQDHLGVGFYSDAYESIPNRPTLELPELDELQEPAFYHRNPMHFEWSPATSDATKDYARKNREFPPSGSPHNSAHTFRNTAPTKTAPSMRSSSNNWAKSSRNNLPSAMPACRCRSARWTDRTNWAAMSATTAKS